MFTQKYKNKRAIFYPASSTKFILFLPGFPKYPARDEFIRLFNQKNFNVLCPIYTGSFDSFGYFSITNCVRDLDTWNAFLTKGEFFIGFNKKTRIVNPREIILFSQSFGSYITDLALRKYEFDKIKKIIFLSPLFKPCNYINEETEKTAAMTKKALKHSFPFSYRIKEKNKLLDELSGLAINALAEKPLKNQTKSVLILSGKDDAVTPPQMAKNLSREYYNSRLNIIRGGHSSSINFKEFARCVNKFL